VQVLADGSVVMILPEPEIFISALYNEKTFVYDRDIGFFTKGDIHLESAARAAAEEEIEKAALEDGILDLARRNAESTITQLLLSLNLENVIIVQATPSG